MTPSSKSTKLGNLIEGALLYVITQGAKILKGEHIGNAFLVHRLIKRDEFLHEKVHLCVAGRVSELWSTSSGSRNFQQRISRRYLDGDEIWLCIRV